MSSKLYPYVSGEQFKRVISQFLRVFSGFQYQDGKGDLKQIPVVYGDMDRIAASILQKRDHLTNNRLPMFAVVMNGIAPDSSVRRNHLHTDSIRNESGALSVNRGIGPAFNLSFELNIISSSSTELFQILEQILLIFNPRITIRLDTVQKNSDFITEIELESINPEIQYPLGTDKKIVQYGLTFNVPFRLRTPYIEKDNLIHVIKSRILSDTGISIIEEEIEDEQP